MKNTFENLRRIEASLSEKPTRSAWSKGVKAYAFDILDNFKEWADNGYFPPLIEKSAMNGARNWQEYSYGGSSLLYDSDIAERLCSPSELRRVRMAESPYGGVRQMANGRETWLDCQARALFQAWQMIEQAMQ